MWIGTSDTFHLHCLKIAKQCSVLEQGLQISCDKTGKQESTGEGKHVHHIALPFFSEKSYAVMFNAA